MEERKKIFSMTFVLVCCHSQTQPKLNLTKVGSDKVGGWSTPPLPPHPTETFKILTG